MSIRRILLFLLTPTGTWKFIGRLKIVRVYGVFKFFMLWLEKKGRDVSTLAVPIIISQIVQISTYTYRVKFTFRLSFR